MRDSDSGCGARIVVRQGIIGALYVQYELMCGAVRGCGQGVWPGDAPTFFSR